jgi:SET domain-containing protein
MEIPYEIKDTEYGLGLFAIVDIPVNTLVWQYKKGINIIEYDEEAALEHLATKTYKECQRFLDLTYGQRGLICEVLDDGKYMNHSIHPNCKTRPGGNTYTIRDIMVGEQLFEDYATFDHPDFLYPLLEKYNCAPDYYEMVPRGMSVTNPENCHDDGNTVIQTIAKENVSHISNESAHVIH